MLKHPVHIFALSCLPFSVLTGWVAVSFATFLVGEVLLLVLVSRLPTYQRWVDAQALARKCAAAAAERERLLAQMTNAHRLELLHLEALADAVRERLTPGATIAVDSDCFGTDNLLAMYVRAAIAYCRGSSALGTSSNESFMSEIRGLTNAVALGRTASARAVSRDRLEIARLRARRWEKSKDDLEVLAGQLALIGEIVRLTFEHAGAPARNRGLDEEIALSLANASESERTVHELTDLLATDVCPDESLLRMGRIPAANQARGGVRVAAGIAGAAEGASALRLSIAEAELEIPSLHKGIYCSQRA